VNHRFDGRGVCEWCEATREKVADRRASWFCTGFAPNAQAPAPGFGDAQARQAQAERDTANDWSGY
jgi:hypothetical protein